MSLSQFTVAGLALCQFGAAVALVAQFGVALLYGRGQFVLKVAELLGLR